MTDRKYRNSQLNQLRLCRYAYQRTYLDGDDGLPSPSLDRGHYAHETIQAAIREVVEHGVLDVHAITYRITRGDRARYAEVLGLLTRFQEALGVEFRYDPDAVFLVEEKLEMPIELADGSTVTFFGTPDVALRKPAKTCLIEDWKTNWHPDTKEEFEVDQQLPRYALLVHHHFPYFERFIVRKRFIRYENSVLERELAVEDLARVQADLVTEIETAIEVEAGEEFPATGGGWCGVCRFHSTCPLITEYRDDGADWLSIPDDDHASVLAQTAIAMDAATKRIKEQLKAYLDPHPVGRVPVAGGTYGYGPVTSRAITVEGLRRVMAEGGADLPDLVLSVDVKALDRLKKRLPEDLARRIDAEIEVSEASRCQFRRGKGSPAPEDAEKEEALT